jgi:hypothetical protein
MAIDSDATFDSSSLWISFLNESIAKQGVILDTDGIWGSRSHRQENFRTGPYKVGGGVNLIPTILTLDDLLLYVMGSGPASSVYSLTETLTPFWMQIDRVAKCMIYNNGFVNRATFSASVADPELKLGLELEFLTETVGAAGSFASGIGTDAHRSYIFSDCIFTLGGTTYTSKSFELTVDNGLMTDRFVNEVSRSQIPATNRDISLKLMTPYTSTESALYNVALGSFGNFTAVFTSLEEASSVLTFTGACAVYPAKTPVIHAKRDEVMLEIDAKLVKTGSTFELAITNSHA